MKRPPGLWILLSAGVLWISLQDVYGIRATALIFGKSTTSTTTEAPSSASSDSNAEEGDAATVASTNSTGNGTENSSDNTTLTGIPQIDYILDPNLPKELNGYNLSEYPFYERVPDDIDIDFKCDGLHDGFYASVPHKCQVYHHCLFGTRYDFLCANYTAFDQKTFICHFVSEVDCVNSKKFWHRNDALYQAASTTTAKPLRLDIYTPPPAQGDAVTPLPSAPAERRGRRPGRPGKRRPQYDYYEDEDYDYDYVRPRPRGRNRPRPRPRPIYDDYDDYEDERYERRGGRRPYRQRDRRRNKGRRKPEYDDEDEEVDERFEDEDFVAANKRHKPEDRRKYNDDDHPSDRDRKRPNDRRRHPDDEGRKRKGNRRPVDSEEYEDELPQSDDSRSYEERPRKGERQKPQEKDGRPVIKPVSGSIYDRPRLAPRINLPVPKNVADKFSYKKTGSSITTTTVAPLPENEEEYDDYEEEPLPKRYKNKNRRDRNKNEDLKSRVNTTPKEKIHEESTEKTTIKPRYGSGRRNKYTNIRTTPPSKKKPVSEEYVDEDYEEEDTRQAKSAKTSTTSTTTTTTPATTTTTTTTTTTEAPMKQEPIVRIVKRPFLPSRGGNPFAARGLQPVGVKAAEKKNEQNEPDKSSTNNGEEELEEEEDLRPPKEPTIKEERKPIFKASPIIIKVPIRPKYTPPTADAQEVFDSESSRQQTYKSKEFPVPRTTVKPQVIPERNPLDLNEYDVTLNDALNPTLPNLPVRGYPTGFSGGNEYSYTTYQRPRYVAVDSVIGSSNAEAAYQPVRQQQRYELVPQPQYSHSNGGYRRREVATGQTQAIYSGY